jgi:predicted amidophosphoribosyltransferase
MSIVCKRCGSEIPTLNRLRKWCVECRKELVNERARIRRNGTMDRSSIEDFDIEKLKIR